LRIIKRNGSEVEFDSNKIFVAISKADASVDQCHQMSDEDIDKVVANVCAACEAFDRACHVEEVQDIVETELMKKFPYVARSYVRYRYDREKLRTKNTTDDSILALIDRTNEEIKQENSNKNPTVNSTLRDYMAGEVSKDLTRRVLLPQDIVDAHEQGIIHFHDSDYFAQHMHNCDLVNLEDMLQNGTVISDTLIEKPKTFSTACNIATQIIAQVASNQYGGQTITLSHLAPFVDETRKKYQEKFKGMGDEFIEKLVHDDVEKGIQTIEGVIKSFFKEGGLHIQINVVDDATLRKAQENPEDYRGLVVRVAGYMAYFTELDRSVQDALIDRTAHLGGC
jgi:ribonucleoside-triphosphate reductase